MGHRPEENQVSSTSGSCCSFAPWQAEHSVGSSIETMISPQSSQYHTGIRWPHHSWREMHQSRMFSIQLKYTLVNRSGTILVRPSLTASIAGSANGLILTYHCSITSGSATVRQRWQWPT